MGIAQVCCGGWFFYEESPITDPLDCFAQVGVAAGDSAPRLGISAEV